MEELVNELAAAPVVDDETVAFFSNLWADILDFLNPVLLARRLIFSVILIALTCIVIKLIFRFFTSLRKRSKKFTPMIEQLLKKTVKVLLWMFCAIAVLQTFGINLAPVIAGLGITGVVLGFALQESISSFFSGVMLAVNTPFRIGDYVEIGSVGGTIVAIDLMCVTLTSPDNKRITMSNKNVWGSTITNYSYITNRRVDMSVSVSYGSDLGKTREAINGILSGYPEVLPSPAPVVEITKLAGSSIDFCVRPWVVPGDYWKVYWRFQQDFVEACRKNGIEIPFDQLDVHIVPQDQS